MNTVQETNGVTGKHEIKFKLLTNWGRCFNNNIKMELFEIGGDLNSNDKIVGGGNSKDEKEGCP